MLTATWLWKTPERQSLRSAAAVPMLPHSTLTICRHREVAAETVRYADLYKLNWVRVCKNVVNGGRAE